MAESVDLAKIRRGGGVKPPLHVLAAACLLLGGCGSARTQPSKPAERAAEPAPTPEPGPPRELTARQAFQQVWVSARSWAPDAEPFRLANIHLENSRGLEGKAAAWTAGFASERLHKWRIYTYSTVKTETLRLGVFAGHEESYRSVSELTGKPFPVQALKADSDEVFRVSEGKGGRAFRKKNSELPVLYIAEYSRRMDRVLWSVYYSASPNDSRFTVRVDAVTGKPVKVEK